MNPVPVTVKMRTERDEVEKPLHQERLTRVSALDIEGDDVKEVVTVEVMNAPYFTMKDCFCIVAIELPHTSNVRSSCQVELSKVSYGFRAAREYQSSPGR